MECDQNVAAAHVLDKSPHGPNFLVANTRDSNLGSAPTHEQNLPFAPSPFPLPLGTYIDTGHINTYINTNWLQQDGQVEAGNEELRVDLLAGLGQANTACGQLLNPAVSPLQSEHPRTTDAWHLTPVTPLDFDSFSLTGQPLLSTLPPHLQDDGGHALQQHHYHALPPPQTLHPYLSPAPTFAPDFQYSMTSYPEQNAFAPGVGRCRQEIHNALQSHITISLPGITPGPFSVPRHHDFQACESYLQPGPSSSLGNLGIGQFHRHDSIPRREDMTLAVGFGLDASCSEVPLPAALCFSGAQLPAEGYQPSAEKRPSAGTDGDGIEKIERRRAAPSVNPAMANQPPPWQIPWPAVGGMPVKRKRGKFEEAKRRETCATRQMGTCIRCKAQRIRCVPNPDDPQNPLLMCNTCQKVDTTSGKLIHPVLCFRLPVTGITIYRPPGLKLTKRWVSDVKVHDVGDWADNEKLVIHFDQGLCDVPVAIEVRRFKPKEGVDELVRRWTNNGEVREQYLPPYGLADIKATAKQFQQYIYDHAAAGMMKLMSSPEKIHPLIRQTFKVAAHHYSYLSEANQKIGEACEQRQFMADFFKLWFAIRHTTGSAWLCGPETLGIELEMDPSYPERLRHKRSLPRMIVEQVDRIQYNFILAPLAKLVLAKLQKFITSNHKDYWFTIFVVTALFLYEASHTSADRRRYGIENKCGTAYHLSSFVEELQNGATVLLQHWHYYRGKVNMTNLTPEVLAKKEPFVAAKLSNEERAYLHVAAETLRHGETKRELMVAKHERNYDHDLYFVSQMFPKEWMPLTTYQEI